MAWLRSAYRRCVTWVFDWLRPSRLIVPYDALVSEDPQVVTTAPGARIVTHIQIRCEMPPGIARLAAILSECIRESAIPSGGGLAGQPAHGG